jgi:hypothetical protein
MLGCACEDTGDEAGMAIRCAIALYGGGESSNNNQTVFRAVFQKRSTAKYMTCKGTEISVQSVR